jgi:hypothetical protein
MMDAKQVAQALQDGFGAISKGQFPESELPDEVRLLINEAYQTGWSIGTRDAEYDAQMAENSHWG